MGHCAAGPTTFRRLTREEYDATVRDLFGDQSAPASSFPADENNMGFSIGAPVSPLMVELYRDAAEGVAERAVQGRLERLLAPCGANAVRDQACAEQIIEHVAARAYRGPVGDASRAGLLRAYLAGAEEGGFENGLRVMLAALLQAPRFLYLVEGGPEASGDEALPLSGPERAARLSYFFWGTLPDEPLFEAALEGRLSTREQVEAQARRMLADPRARESLDRFVRQWLELEVENSDKDPDVFPEWDAELARSMDLSVRRFFDYVVFDSEGTLRELLTSREAFLNPALARVYGVSLADSTAQESQEAQGSRESRGAGAEGPWTRVTLPGTERAGVLTHAAVLAQRALPDDGSPVRRGKLVRERLFCQPLPPPPDGLATVPPVAEPGTTTRERYVRHSEDPRCVSCHRLMDPLGFLFDRYDGIGRYRVAQHGRTLDVRSDILGTRGTDGPVVGAVELAERLGESEDVQRCFTRQMWRFALRRLEMESDACALAEVDRAFAASSGRIQELMVQIALSDPFLYRSRSSSHSSVSAGAVTHAQEAR